MHVMTRPGQAWKQGWKCSHRDHEGDASKRESECRGCGMRLLVEDTLYEKVAPMGRNGGVACDRVSGPCSCGAWH